MAMTPPGRHTGISVEILGSPRVRREDGTDWKPPQLLADLLVTLALAGADGRSREWLRRVLWSQLPSTDANPVVQAVQRLRKHVPIPKPAPGGPYVLDVPAERIDALAFCRGVAELAPDGGRSGPTGATGAAGPDELARVDGLLGMWRGSPWAPAAGERLERRAPGAGPARRAGAGPPGGRAGRVGALEPVP